MQPFKIHKQHFALLPIILCTQAAAIVYGIKKYNVDK